MYTRQDSVRALHQKHANQKDANEARELSVKLAVWEPAAEEVTEFDAEHFSEWNQLYVRAPKQTADLRENEPRAGPEELGVGVEGGVVGVGAQLWLR